MPSLGKSLDVAVSAREAEVLAAVGDHLTNAEIGARLFISIRTVESHVSSLLRKLQVNDRRALAALAPGLQKGPDGASSASPAVVATLPSALTPFVGRVAERAALAAALTASRLVTAVGPGGVGKTRLAQAVAADVRDRFADGVWYVDLVPVTDGAMVGPAIADVLGLGERQGGSAVQDVLGWLTAREALLVLDNCEHLLDDIVVVVEQLLTGSPQLRVLATSRARLLVPFERVFLVPGLSVVADDDRGGVVDSDAVELFAQRAAAGGAAVSSAETARIAAICEAVDGVALAIELAAARYPSIGLDGLEAGLGDRMRMLTGAPRVDDRHRSLRSTLDWSYALLDPAAQAVLRRVSVFADPFGPAAATQVVAGWMPVSADQVSTILADLADQSLLLATAAPSGTRYRALETIRQYGRYRLDEEGESAEAFARHLGWCLDESVALMPTSHEVSPGWRRKFDEVADELRGALAWAADDARYRRQAYGLSLNLGHLTFIRGFPGESQRRYEKAAELASDAFSAADALRNATGAAESRHAGDEALRLRRQVADVALRAGDRVGAAIDLAGAAERINRGPGLMSSEPAAGEVERLIAQGLGVGRRRSGRRGTAADRRGVPRRRRRSGQSDAH